MLKIVAFMCFFSAGTIYGLVLSDKLKKMRDNCREIHSMLMQISVMIRYKRLNVYEIFHELNNSKSFAGLGFLKNLPENYEAGSDVHSLWRDAVSNDIYIGGEEKNILLSFGSVLGTSDAEGQIMSIDSIAESVKVLEVKRSEEYLKKGKLYRSLGMLFGTMAGIVFL